MRKPIYRRLWLYFLTIIPTCFKIRIKKFPIGARLAHCQECILYKISFHLIPNLALVHLLLGWAFFWANSPRLHCFIRNLWCKHMRFLYKDLFKILRKTKVYWKTYLIFYEEKKLKITCHKNRKSSLQKFYDF